MQVIFPAATLLYLCFVRPEWCGWDVTEEDIAGRDTTEHASLQARCRGCDDRNASHASPTEIVGSVDLVTYHPHSLRLVRCLPTAACALDRPWGWYRLAAALLLMSHTMHRTCVRPWSSRGEVTTRSR